MKQPGQLRFIRKSQGGTMKASTAGNLTKMIHEGLPVWRSGMGKEGHGEIQAGAVLFEYLFFRNAHMAFTPP